MPSPIGNFFMKAIVNSPLHRMLGSNIAVVTVEGRKTGKRYATPVNAVRDGDVSTVVSLRSRTWWRNLRDGRIATLRASGKQYSVRGEVLESHSEVVDGLRHFLQRHPGYAKYYGVRLASDGRPMQDDLERVADERVLIRLSSATPQ